MKITRTLQFLAAGTLVLLLSDCKKLDDTPPATNPINSNVTAITDNYVFDDSTLTGAGWTKTFEDNFDSDLSQWNVSSGSGGYEELECYTPDNLQLVNGILQITAKRQIITGTGTDTATKFHFTSGGLLSKATISANAASPKVRVVARIKVATGNGLTSTLTSFGNYWPSQGEIDNMQVVGDNTKQFLTNYFYGPAINQNLVNNGLLFNPVSDDLSAAYHVYETEWTQNALTTYIDGKLVSVRTDNLPGLFGKNENISLALIVGGAFYDSIDPSTVVESGTMYVDYIKVFTSK